MTSTRKKPAHIFPEVINHPDYVKANFTEISGNYDRFNDWVTFGLHRLWKKQTVRTVLSNSEGSRHILDLCCGSGDLTMYLTRLLTKGSEITAVDFSPGMLEIIRRRLDSRDNKEIHVSLLESDVTRLDSFQDNIFNGAVIGFGLRNVMERQACLMEIKRVLKPGGILAILDVGRISYPVLAPLHRFYFESIVPRIGNALHGSKHDMYAYLPESAKIYPDQNTLKAELEGLGYRNVSYKNFLFGSTVLHRAEK